MGREIGLPVTMVTEVSLATHTKLCRFDKRIFFLGMVTLGPAGDSSSPTLTHPINKKKQALEEKALAYIYMRCVGKLHIVRVIHKSAAEGNLMTGKWRQHQSLQGY